MRGPSLGARLKSIAGSRDVHLAVLGGVAWGLCPAPRNIAFLGFAGAPLLMLAIDWTVDRGAPWAIRPTDLSLPAIAKRAFAIGWLQGTIVNAIALVWVVGLLRVFGHFPAYTAVPTGALLWLAQGLPFGFAACVSAVLKTRGVPSWLTLPASLAVFSTIFPQLFPWHIATAELPWLPYVQLAEIGGTSLVDVFLALSGCAIVAGMRARQPILIAIGIAAIAFPLTYGSMRIDAIERARGQARRVRIGVVQPGVTIESRYVNPYPIDEIAHLRRWITRLEREGADFVAMPESAYPFGLSRSQRTDPEGEYGMLRDGVRGPLLFGASTHGERRRVYNSAIVLERDGTISAVVDKVVLLAFGEYVPFWYWLPPLQKLIPSPGVTPGAETRTVDIAGARVGVLNCYEDVLDEQTRNVAKKNPDLLINITNDAWFGMTDEPHLHNAVARFRAIETRRDLVRSVNMGVSSHITATGELRVATGFTHAEGFVADVRVLSGTTPFVRWGDWVGAMLIGALCGTAVASRRKDRART